MTSIKEVFVDLHEKYNKVMKLLTEDSKLDPDNEPYLSKYSARQMLIGMKANLENLQKNHIESIERSKITGMLGAVNLYLGIVSIDVDEMSTGESYLEKCHEIIKDHLNSSELIMVTLNMYNQFGILWAQRDNEKSKTYLEKAEKLYLDYKKSAVPPVDICDLFNYSFQENNTEIAWKNLAKIHTFTLYYLAQIYGSLKDALKSSIYCHITLQRQLDSNDYDPIDWALNAATLSQFFMEKNGFKQARHHLTASSYILTKYEEELNRISERNETYDAKMEIFNHRSADVARCWVKYGLLLLIKSKERLLNHTDDIDVNCSISSDLSFLNLEDSTVTSRDLKSLKFSSLNIDHYENKITDKFILTMQDARLVFLNMQTWLHKAESYYSLDNFASDHIEIVQDKSQIYLNVAFFEDNPENQAKIHKRRIDLLENVVNNVNPKYYLQYCRQIWFELGQTYSEMLNIKSDRLKESSDRPSAHILTKINHLIERILQKQYQKKFLMILKKLSFKLVFMLVL
ncbi:KIF1-binding protein -like [Asbolus verrucosus]|uniref:KIF-binding protein n=1 Tax=Asbolus verrucosus TaxID=1661398 RepID=A0A482VG32_ASBVE|nr:KIF1-binding protein -like [Asbolus verrucosus]